MALEKLHFLSIPPIANNSGKNFMLLSVIDITFPLVLAIIQLN